MIDFNDIIKMFGMSVNSVFSKITISKKIEKYIDGVPWHLRDMKCSVLVHQRENETFSLMVITLAV